MFTLFGRNGAGKTTLLHLAASLMRPSGGELFYGGVPAAGAPDAIRRRIGVVSHASYLYPDLTARENLEFYARLYGLSDRAAAIAEALARAELTLRSEAPVRSLSRGMHQRLAISRALLHRPSLLLLDEPYTGLDPGSADRLSRLIGELRDDGCAILLTTHDLDRGLEVADRIAVLEAGRIVYQGPGRQDPSLFRKTFADLTQRG